MDLVIRSQFGLRGPFRFSFHIRHRQYIIRASSVWLWKIKKRSNVNWSKTCYLKHIESLFTAYLLLWWRHRNETGRICAGESCAGITVLESCVGESCARILFWNPMLESCASFPVLDLAASRRTQEACLEESTITKYIKVLFGKIFFKQWLKQQNQTLNGNINIEGS